MSKRFCKEEKWPGDTRYDMSEHDDIDTEQSAHGIECNNTADPLLLSDYSGQRSNQCHGSEYVGCKIASFGERRNRISERRFEELPKP